MIALINFKIMKKIILVFCGMLCLPAIAAAAFTATANFNVTGVTFGSTVTNMIIISGSASDSWSFDSGVFTITNPGVFKVGSADATVKSIIVKSGANSLVCAQNSTPGTSYVSLPTAAGTYTIQPSATADCCASVAHAATYNSFPTCGAATCASGYTLSGGQCSAVSSSGGGSPAPAIYCSSVVYDSWQPCASGVQYRNVLSQSPSNCILSDAQQTARSMLCGTSPIIPITPPAPVILPNNILQNIADEAGIISADNAQNFLIYSGATADPAKEQASLIKYKIILNLDKNISAEQKTAINDFIVYGTPNTLKLGAGERAGVINSYFQAFGKLPATAADWSDVLKIANGRWTSERSAAGENSAKTEFKKVYGRAPVMTNAADQNAVMVMAYGLLPSGRNLASEAAATKTFRFYYGHAPVSALAWNIVRAIAYSGAKR